MKPVVVRNIKRADSNAIGTLGAVGVSTAHEALGRSGLMKPYMRPIWPGAQIAGPAVTVLAQPGDNWMIHVAVEQCQKGDVLVVGCTTDNTDGMFGELLATALRARGVIGLVIDAGCRDVQPAFRDGVSGLVAGDLGQGHREGHARRGQRAGCLRRRQCRAGRRHRRRRRWRGGHPEKACGRNGAKAQKRKDDEDGKRKQLEAGTPVSTCTTCASRSRKPD